jgi:hypothetical protein
MKANEKKYDVNDIMITATCRFFRRYVSTGRSIMMSRGAVVLAIGQYTYLKKSVALEKQCCNRSINTLLCTLYTVRCPHPLQANGWLRGRRGVGAAAWIRFLLSLKSHSRHSLASLLTSEQHACSASEPLQKSKSTESINLVTRTKFVFLLITILMLKSEIKIM